MQSSKLGLLSIIVSCVATLSILSSSVTVQAFQSTARSSTTIRLHAQNNHLSESEESISAAISRRSALQKSAAAFSILLSGTTAEKANASYSAYTRREDDWKEREKNGGEYLMLYYLCNSVTNNNLNTSVAHTQKSSILAHEISEHNYVKLPQ